MKKIILIGGKARAGKNTLADYLKQRLEEQGDTVIEMMFAQYIKDYCEKMGWDGKTKDEHWRGRLQNLGTEIIKEQLNYKSFHAKRISEDIQIMDSAFDIDWFIITDVRFKDEIYMLKAMFPNDVITVEVQRVGMKSDLTDKQLKHKSENDLNDFNYDYRIIVQEGVQHLYDEADRVLGKKLGYKE